MSNLEQPQVTADAFLTQEEREQLQRLLKYPEEFPREFGAWILDYIAQNGSLTRSQVVGLTQFAPKAASVESNEFTSSTSYVNLTTDGPTIDNIGAGQYMIAFGAAIAAAADHQGNAALGFNGATATDAYFVTAGSPNSGAGGVKSYSVSRTILYTFDTPNNSVKLQYRSVFGGSITFWQRWITLIKVGN